MSVRRTFATLILALTLCSSNLRAADWPTYRGNAERTGHVDGQPGPKKLRVLWAHTTTRENFVGSPAVTGDLICIAGLGAFNSGTVIALEASGEKKIAWTKSPPLLKLPTVSSPVFAAGQVLFGDGMHQTDGAVLRAVDSTSGALVWQHSVPGNLVHLEGAAVIARGRVYLGGGHAGVFCLDPAKLSLAGQERSLAEIRTLLAAEWKKLQETYEKERKVDPDFAVPPSEDSLPKATPRLVWQMGSNAWHVDAPLALAGDKLLAASAYLEVEKAGERALICLDAASGDVVWKTPLDQNPWAGATVSGELAILGCSTIRLDPKEIRKGRGSLVAVQIADGKVKWKKPLPGGIVSSVAVKEGLAISTATDGKVRAHDAVTGESKWTYDAAAPLFAGPAVAGDVVYVGDLKGIVHAVHLADGASLAKLDLNASGTTKGAMIYGSPVVHGGRLYVGTCNLETGAGGLQAIVCIGE